MNRPRRPRDLNTADRFADVAIVLVAGVLAGPVLAVLLAVTCAAVAALILIADGHR